MKFNNDNSFTRFESIRHICGGKATLVSNKLEHGWNEYVCTRCGKLIRKWITDEMIAQHDKES